MKHFELSIDINECLEIDFRKEKKTRKRGAKEEYDLNDEMFEILEDENIEVELEPFIENFFVYAGQIDDPKKVLKAHEDALRGIPIKKILAMDSTAFKRKIPTGRRSFKPVESQKETMCLKDNSEESNNLTVVIENSKKYLDEKNLLVKKDKYIDSKTNNHLKINSKQVLVESEKPSPINGNSQKNVFIADEKNYDNIMSASSHKLAKNHAVSDFQSPGSCADPHIEYFESRMNIQHNQNQPGSYSSQKSDSIVSNELTHSKHMEIDNYRITKRAIKSENSLLDIRNDADQKAGDFRKKLKNDSKFPRKCKSIMENQKIEQNWEKTSPFHTTKYSQSILKMDSQVNQDSNDSKKNTPGSFYKTKSHLSGQMSSYSSFKPDSDIELRQDTSQNSITLDYSETLPSSEFAISVIEHELDHSSKGNSKTPTSKNKSVEASLYKMHSSIKNSNPCFEESRDFDERYSLNIHDENIKFKNTIKSNFLASPQTYKSVSSQKTVDTISNTRFEEIFDNEIYRRGASAEISKKVPVKSIGCVTENKASEKTSKLDSMQNLSIISTENRVEKDTCAELNTLEQEEHLKKTNFDRNNDQNIANFYSGGVLIDSTSVNNISCASVNTQLSGGSVNVGLILASTSSKNTSADSNKGKKKKNMLFAIEYMLRNELIKRDKQSVSDDKVVDYFLNGLVLQQIISIDTIKKDLKSPNLQCVNKTQLLKKLADMTLELAVQKIKLEEFINEDVYNESFQEEIWKFSDICFKVYNLNNYLQNNRLVGESTLKKDFKMRVDALFGEKIEKNKHWALKNVAYKKKVFFSQHQDILTDIMENLDEKIMINFS